MDRQTASSSARHHRAGRRLTIAFALAAIACSSLPSPAGAAGPPGPPDRTFQQLMRHHRVASSESLRTTLQIVANMRHSGRIARVTALPARGSSLCVGSGSGCLATIQAALDAAHDGDTIHLGSGTFAGGVTITKSVRLAGSGAKSTVIHGGGPVVMIGTFGAAVEPMVTISGVTITGGITRSSPESVPFTGEEGVFAVGGGVEIPPNGDFSGGATVTITDSEIRGNRVAPSRTVPSGGAVCPGGPCPFAMAAGGGIDNWGTLTLSNTNVRDNLVGSASGLSDLASDADSGGIMSWQGSLTVIDSTISGNRTTAIGPNGRFAEAGGIFAIGGSLSMKHSAVTDNHVSLDAALPDSVDMGANSGGIHVGGGASATIRGTTISGNSVSMTNSLGYAVAFSGALHTDVEVDLRNDVMANNSVNALTTAGSFAGADSGAGEISGTVAATRITGNTVDARSEGGDGGAFASAIAGALVFRGTMIESVVSDNHVGAESTNGVFVAGGGIIEDFAGVTLTDTVVSRNTAIAIGLSGSVRGGGIFDAAIDFGPPGGPLTLTRSRVERNAVSGGPGLTVLGGGIFTDNVVTSIDSVVAKNAPDQCVGC